MSVIEELDSQCDLLLIDSPPVLPVTDAQVISGLVDGVLLVGSAGSSTKRDVRRAVELLHQVDAPLIGSILNGVALEERVDVHLRRQPLLRRRDRDRAESNGDGRSRSAAAQQARRQRASAR